jgi:uncharacterized protein YecT (DUF1311 family)
MNAKAMLCVATTCAIAHAAAHARNADASCNGEEIDAVYEAQFDLLDDEHRVLLEQAQQAWLDYRESTCVIVAERPGRPDIADSAMEACSSYMARERVEELRLLGRLLLAP